MQSLVSIRRCDDYASELLKPAIERALADLGGLSAFVKSGDRILLKPNLLMGSAASKAVVTHPAFVEAVAETVVDCGGRPFIGESPAVGHLVRTLNKSGYGDFMQRLGIEAVPFRTAGSFDYPEDRLYRRIDLAREAFEFDAVINLAKLKTHGQMYMTLAVKNLFGTVIGTDKASWHLRAGRDFRSFATALAQIYEKVDPAVSLVDGVLGMEGDGPSNGAPRRIGLIGASTDAIALDATVCRLVGLNPERLLTSVVGESLGIGAASEDRIDVVGDSLEGFPLKGFKPPKTMTVTWNLPYGGVLRRFLENRMVTRPKIQASECALCKVCLNHCPPGAITETERGLTIDYGKCISCYCCHELCENDAIRLDRPLMAGILGRLTR